MALYIIIQSLEFVTSILTREGHGNLFTTFDLRQAGSHSWDCTLLEDQDWEGGNLVAAARRGFLQVVGFPNREVDR